MLRGGAQPQAEDFVSSEEEIKDPLMLEFLNLKASEYRLALPDEKVLAAQLEQTRKALAARGLLGVASKAPTRTKKNSQELRTTAHKRRR